MDVIALPLEAGRARDMRDEDDHVPVSEMGTSKTAYPLITTPVRVNASSSDRSSCPCATMGVAIAAMESPAIKAPRQLVADIFEYFLC